MISKIQYKMRMMFQHRMALNLLKVHYQVRKLINFQRQKIRSNTDFKIIMNGRKLRSWEELVSPLENINPGLILRILVMMEPVVLIWIK